MKYYLLLLTILLSGVRSKSQGFTRVTDVPIGTVYSVEQHNNILFAGTVDKVYISTDLGMHWHATTSPGAGAAILTYSFFKGKLYIGTFNKGVFRSDDMGVHWQQVNAGLGIPSVSKFVIWKNELYLSSYGAGVFRFNDNTSVWSPFNNNLGDLGSNVWDMALVGNSLLATAGSNGFFYLYDTLQQNWNLVEIFNRIRAGYQGLQIAQDSNVVYLATQDFLLRSEDTGKTWNYDPVGMHIGQQWVTAGHQFDFVTVNFLDVTMNAQVVKVYQRPRGVDRGSGWSLTDSFLNAFFYSILAYNGNLWVGRDSGLYYKQVEDATVTAIPPIDRQVQALTLYPNPSTGKSAIKFSLTGAKKVSVEVLDITGRTLFTPYSNLSLGIGNYSLDLDLSRLPSALYFVHILTGNGQVTKKLLISR